MNSKTTLKILNKGYEISKKIFKTFLSVTHALIRIRETKYLVKTDKPSEKQAGQNFNMRV